ncbi:hypothetical protein [Spongiactinospora sp. TRM90649]|uniref:hypothetical protein n=1 Tax=Spongiactinospora sp. TRM90649 TaxID=3031114 RepID=UPI0023F93347|nr:hypothetical protein [Spongiactinospora sp. TRM90649]MDF5754108.1 hypothetical protein [Spongiactinospora sp. TRM90649]
MTEVNKGIQISGGNVQGPMAVGANARAEQYIGASRASEDDVARLLARIRELVEEHRAELGDQARPALREADRIEAELAEDDPDADFLSDSLDRMTRRVTAVTTLTQAVGALAALILN